jgi:hypothetical protein
MEERVLKGDLAYESSMPRLAGDEERFVLLAMHQTLVERGLQPERLASISPGLPATAGYPGSLSENGFNPEGVASWRRPIQPLQGCGALMSFTQGSRFAPTLG